MEKLRGLKIIIMETVLIVDDNDRYANNLKTYLDKRNIPSERAFTASQGYEMFLASQYTTIISDITMETQTSGLVFIRKIFNISTKGLRTFKEVVECKHT